MSSNCPQIDEKEVSEYINQLMASNTELKEAVDTLNTCSDIIGGKRRKRRTLKGGMTRKALIKALLYIIIGALAALMGVSRGAINILQGLQMLVSGECTSVTGYVWYHLGLTNPICAKYIYMRDTILKALLGDPIALASITAIVTAVIAGPGRAIRGINKIVDRVDSIIASALGEMPAITSSSATPALESSKGGKTKRKRSYRKKSRKSRKSRRN